jgi:hypothetical protein
MPDMKTRYSFVFSRLKSMMGVGDTEEYEEYYNTDEPEIFTISPDEDMLIETQGTEYRGIQKQQERPKVGFKKFPADLPGIIREIGGNDNHGSDWTTKIYPHPEYGQVSSCALALYARNLNFKIDSHKEKFIYFKTLILKHLAEKHGDNSIEYNDTFNLLKKQGDYLVHETSSDVYESKKLGNAGITLGKYIENWWKTNKGDPRWPHIPSAVAAGLYITTSLNPWTLGASAIAGIMEAWIAFADLGEGTPLDKDYEELMNSTMPFLKTNDLTVRELMVYMFSNNGTSLEATTSLKKIAEDISIINKSPLEPLINLADATGDKRVIDYNKRLNNPDAGNNSTQSEISELKNGKNYFDALKDIMGISIQEGKIVFNPKKRQRAMEEEIFRQIHPEEIEHDKNTSDFLLETLGLKDLFFLNREKITKKLEELLKDFRRTNGFSPNVTIDSIRNEILNLKREIKQLSQIRGGQNTELNDDVNILVQTINSVISPHCITQTNEGYVLKTNYLQNIEEPKILESQLRSIVQALNTKNSTQFKIIGSFLDKNSNDTIKGIGGMLHALSESGISQNTQNNVKKEQELITIKKGEIEEIFKPYKKTLEFCVEEIGSIIQNLQNNLEYTLSLHPEKQQIIENKLKTLLNYINETASQPDITNFSFEEFLDKVEIVFFGNEFGKKNSIEDIVNSELENWSFEKYLEFRKKLDFVKEIQQIKPFNIDSSGESTDLNKQMIQLLQKGEKTFKDVMDYFNLRDNSEERNKVLHSLQYLTSLKKILEKNINLPSIQKLKEFRNWFDETNDKNPNQTNREAMISWLSSGDPKQLSEGIHKAFGNIRIDLNLVSLNQSNRVPEKELYLDTDGTYTYNVRQISQLLVEFPEFQKIFEEIIYTPSNDIIIEQNAFALPTDDSFASITKNLLHKYQKEIYKIGSGDPKKITEAALKCLAFLAMPMIPQINFLKVNWGFMWGAMGIKVLLDTASKESQKLGLSEKIKQQLEQNKKINNTIKKGTETAKSIVKTIPFAKTVVSVVRGGVNILLLPPAIGLGAVNHIIDKTLRIKKPKKK